MQVQNNKQEIAPFEKRRTAATYVQEQLRQRIESGVFRPDERLPSEAELAGLFGVSRPVVREALMSLQALGYTESQTGRGTFVVSNRISSSLVFGRYTPAQIQEVRCALEVPVVQLAAIKRTEQDIGVLASLLGRLDEASDPDRRNQLDADFHTAIAKASGNPLFVMLIEDMRGVLEGYAKELTKAPYRRNAARAEHAEIYKAIVQRDPVAAGEAMIRHLHAGEEVFGAVVVGALPVQRNGMKRTGKKNT
ncbi:MAG: FadR/GntR family transcriptional regulator [Pigmentiphaga sp.]|uniref:FadR/GntR family transcriptional regulator n=1 Tax=Pigmentiphaga sp. TaxID=1977564 RepID=UPI0029B5EEBF|nr:FadR/GntR family transcriptional regulator [Pigmentiphaga sp.]MDX3906989.1 FadR/GntR family transcriptional regulator [Pigmentiphaga sp.]